MLVCHISLKRYQRINEAEIHSSVDTNLPVNSRTCLKKQDSADPKPFRNKHLIKYQLKWICSVLRSRGGLEVSWSLIFITKTEFYLLPDSHEGPGSVFTCFFFFYPAAAPPARGGALAPPPARAATAPSKTSFNRFMQLLLRRSVCADD